MKINKISIYLIFALFALTVNSCTDYLEKTPDSTISAEEAFKDFMNFQGFVEQIYICVPDKLKNGSNSTINWGDDELMNGGAPGHFTAQVDLGNYWNWCTSNTTWLYKSNDNPSSTANSAHGLYSGGWYAIRKANLGLENFDKLKDATQLEKDVILGQLYFFRAFFHFEMSMYWGELPYIQQSLDAADIPRYGRLPYNELIDLIAADFRKAADLLPIDWDDELIGEATFGKNSLRLTRVAALSYLGKAYLYGASPLMVHGAQLGGTKTYDYDAEYAAKAAEAFGEALAIIDKGDTRFSLAEFDYTNVYNHEKNPAASSCFTEIIYTHHNNFAMPGSTELIFAGPAGNQNGAYNSIWAHGLYYGPKVNAMVSHDNVIHLPAANYVDLYGMDNGLPLDDPASGWDPKFPYKNRDPRFYHDIMFDGFEFVTVPIPTKDDPKYKYLELANGGWAMDDYYGSRSGYYYQKLAPHFINKYEWNNSWGAFYHAHLPYMRVADVYLMYAEALAATDGPSGKSSNFTLSAEEAINKVRDARGVGHVAATYTGDNKKFMDEIRRERAVELAWEGHRFCDLRRWLLLTEPGYTVKTKHTFDRVHDNDWYKTNDPRDAEVVNFKEEVVVERQLSIKHYWLPFPRRDVQLSTDFQQNPGW